MGSEDGERLQQGLRLEIEAVGPTSAVEIHYQSLPRAAETNT